MAMATIPDTPPAPAPPSGANLVIRLVAGILLLGLIGFISNALLAQAEWHLLKWQKP